MYFTFSEEPSFGEDSTSQDYVVDLLEENVIDNIEYDKLSEFNHPTSQKRINKVKTVDGRIGLGLTFDNQAWNILFKNLLGRKVRLTGFALARSVEKWNIVTGILTTDINSSQTTFAITEYKTGEFNNVSGVIVNNEYIKVNVINNGGITGSDRHSEGSTAASHLQNALVYGVVSSGGNTVDIISRYRSGFSYLLPTSVTCLIYREGDYFCFNGVHFQGLVFNARPAEGVSTSLMLKGRDARVIDIANPSQAIDENDLVDTDQINGFSMGEWIDISHLYFQVSNTLSQGSAKFMDNTCQAMILNRFSTYGQFSIPESNLDFYKNYINDDEKNLSVTICNSRLFDKAFVFAFNKIKIGTMQHILRTTRLVHDSIPFYVFGEDSFTVLIQN